MQNDTDDFDDDLDGEDPTQWGNAELGAPKSNPAAPRTKRSRRAPSEGSKRELAERAKRAIATMPERPPWPGAAKPIPVVLEDVEEDT